jgi:uroporphyrin-III C-methyltransferase/precorrin-2 dehydrogenase/sirohydrochlorin ferrochelatase
MDFLPLYFNLRGRHCLLVGGGEIAYRKAQLLVDAGATLKVVAKSINEDIRRLAASGDHKMIEREFRVQDLNDVLIVVSATNDSVANALVSKEAQQRNIPVNVVDRPELCTIIFPAIVDRSPVIVAVSTGGASPVVTRRIRELLEGLIGEGFSRLTSYLGGRRDRLKERFADTETRRRHTERFLDSAGAGLAMDGRYEEADAYLDSEGDYSTGEVYLVGAGPGDPDLLTLKALQLMQTADIVLYDNLVSNAVLGRVRRDARKESVGKEGGGSSTSQESINDMLIRLAQEGHRVLRLKGGDPFIFGRGGEEIETLADAGISFQVVPGITAANGCAAYTGIPLTHRDYSQSVRFVTGHPREGRVNLEWSELVHKNQTIVFYMGLGGLASICQNMIEHGRGPSTPVAIIEKGTTPEQRVLIGTLSNIVELVEQNEIGRPTLTIVGDVVELYDRIGISR